MTSSALPPHFLLTIARFISSRNGSPETAGGGGARRWFFGCLCFRPFDFRCGFCPQCLAKSSSGRIECDNSIVIIAKNLKPAARMAVHQKITTLCSEQHD